MLELIQNIDQGTLIASIVSILGIFGGAVKWIQVLFKKSSKAIKFGREAFELINELEKAFEDGKLDKKEIESIFKEAKDVKIAFNELRGKNQ